jgi:hypothetical protein
MFENKFEKSVIVILAIVMLLYNLSSKIYFFVKGFSTTSVDMIQKISNTFI